MPVASRFQRLSVSTHHVTKMARNKNAIQHVTNDTTVEKMRVVVGVGGVAAMVAAMVPTVASFSHSPTTAFHISKQPATVFDGEARTRQNVIVTGMSTVNASCLRQNRPACRAVALRQSSSSNDGEGRSNSLLNKIPSITSVPFAAAYVTFMLFAFYMSSHEAPGASQEVLDKFIQDPIHPGVNELFASVFNLLGLIPIPMACLLLPAGSSQNKLPSVPFVAASAFAGYGALGLFMMTRTPVTTEISKSELGWFTANVLENKLFNYIVVAAACSTFWVTGLVQGVLDNAGGELQGYMDLVSHTAIASASSLDLVILTLTAASLIPEDLKRRGVSDASKANAIAVSTILLPVVGSTIYCALRPSLKN